MRKEVKLTCNFIEEDYLVIFKNEIGHYVVDFFTDGDRLIVDKESLENLIENLEEMIND